MAFRLQLITLESWEAAQFLSSWFIYLRKCVCTYLYFLPPRLLFVKYNAKSVFQLTTKKEFLTECYDFIWRQLPRYSTAMFGRLKLIQPEAWKLMMWIQICIARSLTVRPRNFETGAICRSKRMIFSKLGSCTHRAFQQPLEGLLAPWLTSTGIIL